MKLLILTQKIDRTDPILGFFHRWVEEFAKHCKSVTIICLQEGEHNLPQNVRVLSLGKGKVKSQKSKVKGLEKLKYVFNFYKHIWRERKNYDTVFVHMNQEYVLLGGLLWKLLGEKVMMWRNHLKGDWMTRLAVFFSDRVFCTSEYSYTARYKKTSIMPVGIDTDLFRRDETITRTPNSILFLGRISPVKNLDVFVRALELLDKKGVNFVGNIYGDPLEIGNAYYEEIKKLAQKLEDKGKIIFHAAVPNHKTPKVYNQNEIFVNLTESGSFDKTILEASACECLVIVSNQSLKDMLSEQFLFRDRNASELAEKLYIILFTKNNKEEYGKTLRQYAIRHDMPVLVKKILDLIK